MFKRIISLICVVFIITRTSCFFFVIGMRTIKIHGYFTSSILAEEKIIIISEMLHINSYLWKSKHLMIICIWLRQRIVVAQMGFSQHLRCELWCCCCVLHREIEFRLWKTDANWRLVAEKFEWLEHNMKRSHRSRVTENWIKKKKKENSIAIVCGEKRTKICINLRKNSIDVFLRFSYVLTFVLDGVCMYACEKCTFSIETGLRTNVFGASIVYERTLYAFVCGKKNKAIKMNT